MIEKSIVNNRVQPIIPSADESKAEPDETIPLKLPQMYRDFPMINVADNAID